MAFRRSPVRSRSDPFISPGASAPAPRRTVEVRHRKIGCFLNHCGTVGLELARRTGRFPQLVAPRLGLIVIGDGLIARSTVSGVQRTWRYAECCAFGRKRGVL